MAWLWRIRGVVDDMEQIENGGGINRRLDAAGACGVRTVRQHILTICTQPLIVDARIVLALYSKRNQCQGNANLSRKKTHEKLNHHICSFCFFCFFCFCFFT